MPSSTQISTFSPSTATPTSLTRPASGTISWQTLMTLDHKSDDFTHLARRLLNDQRRGKSEVSRFTDEEGLKLIELIEPTVCPTMRPTVREYSNAIHPQILQHADIPGDLKSTAFTMLRRLCGTFGRLPSSCLINEDLKMQEEIPFATRGYTDLWKRAWSGRKVAVKALRFAPDDDRSKTTKVRVFSGQSRGELTSARRGFVKKFYCGSA